jgi:cell shape-determining protein MreD
MVVVYICFLLPWKAGLFWIWNFGWMRDALSCFPIGIYASAYLLSFFLVHRAHSLFESRNRFVYAWIVCFGVNLWIQMISGLNGNMMYLFCQSAVLSIYSTVLAVPLFFLMSPLERITWSAEEKMKDDISGRLLFHWTVREEKGL